VCHGRVEFTVSEGRSSVENDGNTLTMNDSFGSIRLLARALSKSIKRLIALLNE